MTNLGWTCPHCLAHWCTRMPAGWSVVACGNCWKATSNPYPFRDAILGDLQEEIRRNREEVAAGVWQPQNGRGSTLNTKRCAMLCRESCTQSRCRNSCDEQPMARAVITQ